MDVKNIPVYPEIIEGLKKTRTELADRAKSYPGTSEEYTALEPSERMKKAAEIFYAYLPISSHWQPGFHGSPYKNNIEPVKLAHPTEAEGVFIESWIFYTPYERGQGRLFQPETISVSSFAKDKFSGLQGGHVNIGEIKFNREPVVVIEKVRDEGGRKLKSNVSPDHEQAAFILELVDEAVCSIIESKIAVHQQLGSLATSASE